MTPTEARDELHQLALAHGWYAINAVSADEDWPDWAWLNLTKQGGTCLDIEWRADLPTGCQIHASHFEHDHRLIVNTRSHNLLRRAITDPDWITHAITLRDSSEPIIDLRDEAA